MLVINEGMKYGVHGLFLRVTDDSSSDPLMLAFPGPGQMRRAISERWQKAECRFHLLRCFLDFNPLPMLLLCAQVLVGLQGALQRDAIIREGVDLGFHRLLIDPNDRERCLIPNDTQLTAIVLNSGVECSLPCISKSPILPVTKTNEY